LFHEHSFPTTIIRETFRSQALISFVVLLFVLRKSDDYYAIYVRVVLSSDKKANCITVQLPVNKLVQAYESVNQRRLGYRLTW